MFEHTTQNTLIDVILDEFNYVIEHNLSKEFCREHQLQSFEKFDRQAFIQQLTGLSWISAFQIVEQSPDLTFIFDTFDQIFALRGDFKPVKQVPCECCTDEFDICFCY